MSFITALCSPIIITIINAIHTRHNHTHTQTHICVFDAATAPTFTWTSGTDCHSSLLCAHPSSSMPNTHIVKQTHTHTRWYVRHSNHPNNHLTVMFLPQYYNYDYSSFFCYRRGDQEKQANSKAPIFAPISKRLSTSSRTASSHHEKVKWNEAQQQRLSPSLPSTTTIRSTTTTSSQSTAAQNGRKDAKTTESYWTT